MDLILLMKCPKIKIIILLYFIMEYSFIGDTPESISVKEPDLDSYYRQTIIDTQKNISNKKQVLEPYYKTEQFFKNQQKNEYERHYETNNKQKCTFFHDDSINQHKCQRETEWSK